MSNAFNFNVIKLIHDRRKQEEDAALRKKINRRALQKAKMLTRVQNALMIKENNLKDYNKEDYSKEDPFEQIMHH